MAWARRPRLARTFARSSTSVKPRLSSPATAGRPGAPSATVGAAEAALAGGESGPKPRKVPAGNRKPLDTIGGTARDRRRGALAHRDQRDRIENYGRAATIFCADLAQGQPWTGGDRRRCAPIRILCVRKRALFSFDFSGERRCPQETAADPSASSAQADFAQDDSGIDGFVLSQVPKTGPGAPHLDGKVTERQPQVLRLRLA